MILEVRFDNDTIKKCKTIEVNETVTAFCHKDTLIFDLLDNHFDSGIFQLGLYDKTKQIFESGKHAGELHVDLSNWDNLEFNVGFNKDEIHEDEPINKNQILGIWHFDFEDEYDELKALAKELNYAMNKLKMELSTEYGW